MQQKIILTTVPTGLGHLRVTKALINALPEEENPQILGIADNTIATIYRIISTNYYLRKLLEFTQTNQIAERIVTNILNTIQTINTKQTEQELTKLIGKNETTKIIIVSTHAFIAQKIQKIIKNKTIANKIVHAVVVTDDSPQRFWMIDADMIFVPSTQTKEKLAKLFMQDKRTIPNIIINPYPVNPKFTKKLPPESLANKINQINPTNEQITRICIPVSGAAVQLDFYTILIERLRETDRKEENKKKYTFSIITREGNYTKQFINHFRNYPEITFHIGANDLQTIELYDQLYFQLNPPAIEITKPSEQCFKALLPPHTIGGPILLLTDPIGRQEYDNLNFLERHGLIPNQQTTDNIYKALIHNDNEKIENYKQTAQSWRALRLPSNPLSAVEYIKKGLQKGLFLAMQAYKEYTATNELATNGAEKIWEIIFTNMAKKITRT